MQCPKYAASFTTEHVFLRRDRSRSVPARLAGGPSNRRVSFNSSWAIQWMSTINKAQCGQEVKAFWESTSSTPLWAMDGRVRIDEATGWHGKEGQHEVFGTPIIIGLLSRVLFSPQVEMSPSFS